MFFDIDAGGKDMGRITLELRADVVPKTAGNPIDSGLHPAILYSLYGRDFFLSHDTAVCSTYIFPIHRALRFALAKQLMRKGVCIDTEERIFLLYRSKIRIFCSEN